MHCTAAYNSMEAAVYNMYDRNNATIQDKLHELFEVLERTGKIWNHVWKEIVYQALFLSLTNNQNLDPGKTSFTFDVCVAITTAKQEAELEEFKSALAALYSDIQGAPL